MSIFNNIRETMLAQNIDRQFIEDVLHLGKTYDVVWELLLSYALSPDDGVIDRLQQELAAYHSCEDCFGGL